MLFSDAVTAKLPLISVTTRDLMNFADVVKHVTSRSPIMFKPDMLASVPGSSLCIYVADQKALAEPAKLYAAFVKKESTLLIVNAKTKVDEAFDAGELAVPTDMMRKALMEAFSNEEFVDTLMPTVGGLSLKELGEVIRLTEVRDDEISPQGITKTRAILVPDLQGFSAVQTGAKGPYIPNPELAEYAAENKHLFLAEDEDPRLVPRGLLFDGKSGTGKTEGAKWLAREWGVPLYRLDSTILNKYYGESENSLKQIFAKVGQEAPCVLLLDEVEKLFGKSKSGEQDGMTSRLLGLILWQMQESDDHVFIVMTSNRKEILPEELYREGRIDDVVTFVGLVADDAQAFGQVILRSFFAEPEKTLVSVAKKAIATLFEGNVDRVSHASITGAIQRVVKKHKKTQHGG